MMLRITACALMLLAASGSLYAESDSGNVPPYSGFLKESYAKLQQSASQPGTWSYVDPSVDFKPYAKLMIEPVKIYNPPYQTNDMIAPGVLYQMRNDMLASLNQAFASGYQLVQQPGPDVLRVRVSVFGVEMVKPDWQLGDNTPIKKGLDLITGGKAVPLMTAEMEVLDPQGRSVAAAIATRKGDKQFFREDKLQWEDLQPIVEFWAGGLRQSLDRLRGVSATATGAP